MRGATGDHEFSVLHHGEPGRARKVLEKDERGAHSALQRVHLDRLGWRWRLAVKRLAAWEALLHVGFSAPCRPPAAAASANVRPSPAQAGRRVREALQVPRRRHPRPEGCALPTAPSRRPPVLRDLYSPRGPLTRPRPPARPPRAASFDGAHLCTLGADKSAKVYDVLNFDMMHMLKLDFTPFCCEWIYRARGPARPRVAASPICAESARCTVLLLPAGCAPRSRGLGR